MRRTLNTVRILLASALLSSFSLAAVSATSVSNATKPQVSTQAIHNTISQEVPAKGDAHGNVVHPDTTWTLSLAASSNNLWPTQSSTLTATTNMNVGPTPYYIEIFDNTAHNYVAICATGTSCTATVTQPQPTTHSYIAYVAYYPSSMSTPPTGIQASASAYVLWHGVNITLAVNYSTLPLNGVATLTSTTSQDISTAPQWTEIYDATTGTRLNDCGFGTTCSATISEAAATTHKFVAYVSNLSTLNPPTGIIATSNAVFTTWTSGNYRVSLTGPTTTYGSPVTLTATSNVNVGPTPYYIEIYNVDTGARIAVCGTGTTCSASASLHYGANHFEAFISSYSTVLPPSGTQATSNELTTFLRIIP